MLIADCENKYFGTNCQERINIWSENYFTESSRADLDQLSNKLSMIIYFYFSSYMTRGRRGGPFAVKE